MLTLYWNHVTLDLRIGVNTLALLVYVGLTLLAIRDSHKTSRRIAMQFEWGSSQFSPWSEGLILLTILVIWWNTALVLTVRRSSDSAQLLGTLAALLLVARGLLVLVMRRRDSQQMWAAGEQLQKITLTTKDL